MKKVTPVDVELTVECICCKATKTLRASDGPHNDIPICEKDGFPMIAKKAQTTRKSKTK